MKRSIITVLSAVLVLALCMSAGCAGSGSTDIASGYDYDNGVFRLQYDEEVLLMYDLYEQSETVLLSPDEGSVCNIQVIGRKDNSGVDATEYLQAYQGNVSASLQVKNVEESTAYSNGVTTAYSSFTVPLETGDMHLRLKMQSNGKSTLFIAMTYDDSITDEQLAAFEEVFSSAKMTWK